MSQIIFMQPIPKILIAVDALLKKQKQIRFTPSQSTLKYGSENRACMKGLSVRTHRISIVKNLPVGMRRTRIEEGISNPNSSNILKQDCCQL